MNIQGWYSLGLTGLLSWLSKGLSGIFSSTTVWKHQFFSAEFSYQSIYLHLKKWPINFYWVIEKNGWELTPFPWRYPSLPFLCSECVFGSYWVFSFLYWFSKTLCSNHSSWQIFMMDFFLWSHYICFTWKSPPGVGVKHLGTLNVLVVGKDLKSVEAYQRECVTRTRWIQICYTAADFRKWFPSCKDLFTNDP